MPGAGRLAPAVTELVDIAVELGFTSIDNDNGGVTISRGDKHVVIPPVKSWNEGKLRGLRNTIMTYADPELVKAREARMTRRAPQQPAPPAEDVLMQQMRELLTRPLADRVLQLEGQLAQAYTMNTALQQQRDAAWRALDALGELIAEEASHRG